MKRRIALLLVLVLALSCVLASCGTKECDVHVDENIDEICDVCEAAVPYTPTYLGFEGYYNTTFESNEKAALTAAAKVDGLAGLYYSSGNGNLAMFRNDAAKDGEVKLAVLNTDTGAVVYSLLKEKTEGTKPDKFEKNASIIAVGDMSKGVSYFIKESYRSWNTYTYTDYTLITALGARVDTVADWYEPTMINEDFMEFGGKIYLLEDDVATQKFDKNFVRIPDYDVKTDKYYYDVQNYGSNTRVYMYDQNFKLVEVYYAPADAMTSQMFVLADGNVLTQGIYILPEDAADYDIIEASTNNIGEAYTYKYNLVTTIYNVETKETTEVNVNYMIQSLSNKLSEEFTERFVADKLDNVAYVIEIVDGKIDENKAVWANVRTSDAKLLGYLAQEIPAQSGFAKLFDDNRFIVTDKSGKEYLIDEKANVLGEVTDAYTISNASVPESVFAYVEQNHNIKYYDSSLNLIYDVANGEKYSWNTGIIYHYSYDSYDKDGDPIVVTDYYYKSADYKYVKLDITKSEFYTLSSGTGYFEYTDTVVENEGTPEAKTAAYDVVFNNEGTQVFKLNRAAVETTDAETSKKITTTEKVSGVSLLNNGSLAIYVQKTIATEGVSEPKVEYSCYIAK